MNQNRILLGAFWIEGTDKFFYGLRDAKNYQLVKGGNILDAHGKLLYPDPFPLANACTECSNKITPTGAFLGATFEELPAKCSDCGGVLKTAEAEIAKPKKNKFWNLFKRSNKGLELTD
jgi:hypothetical protein